MRVPEPSSPRPGLESRGRSGPGTNQPGISVCTCYAKPGTDMAHLPTHLPGTDLAYRTTSSYLPTRALPACTRLGVLELSYNEISDEGVQSLVAPPYGLTCSLPMSYALAR
eukprot:1642601-Rhodomonas_salina.10